MADQLRIVVADDERDSREYFHFVLARLGYDVRNAEDGRQLVQVCREFNPDVIVTDYAMPGLDGLSAVASLNRERPVPVVLISGRQDIDPGNAAAEIAYVRCLAKPVKAGELESAVTAAVAASRPKLISEA